MGGDLDGVFTVRTLADVDAMRAEFAPGRRVVIVGGGYIGLEAAAVARKLGLDVTVLEMAPRILQRVAAPETSDYIRALHTAHGAVIMESTGLDRLLGEGHVSGVRLQDGRELPARVPRGYSQGFRPNATAHWKQRLARTALICFHTYLLLFSYFLPLIFLPAC